MYSAPQTGSAALACHVADVAGGGRRQLDDGARSLASYGVSADSTLMLLGRLLGGMDDGNWPSPSAPMSIDDTSGSVSELPPVFCTTSRKRFVLGLQIGTGSFGIVWQLKTLGGVLIADQCVKKVPARIPPSEAHKFFETSGKTMYKEDHANALQELLLLGQLRHPYIVKVHGYEHNYTHLSIIMEKGDMNL
jgi:serine/threonine protein kinase